MNIVSAMSKLKLIRFSKTINNSNSDYVCLPIFYKKNVI